MTRAHTLPEESVERIIEATGLALTRRAFSTLWVELDRIAQAHLLYLRTRPSHNPPGPVEAEKRLRALAKRVASIEREISGELKPWLEMVDLIPHEKMRTRYLRGEEVRPPPRLLADASKGLRAIEILTEFSIKEAQLRSGRAPELADFRELFKTGDRRSAFRRWIDDPLSELLPSLCDRNTVYGALANAYRKCFQRPFVAHRAKSGKDDDFGPAVRFVRAFFAELHKIDSRTEVPTGEAIRSWRRRAQAPRPANQAPSRH